MIKIGLTGSIGMGKSTTAALFAEFGAAVDDADAAVARLYAKGGATVAPVAEIAPEAVVDGAVDRSRLKAVLAADPQLFGALERIVHPLVRAEREDVVARAAAAGVDLIVFDIPLLFETGVDQEMDVVVVTAPPEVQRERVLARPGVTEADFERLLARQTPDAEKKARADFVIDTSHGIDAAREEVRRIVETLRAEDSA